MTKSSVMRLAGAAVMAGFLLAGCSDKTPGDATPGQNTSSAPTSDVTGPTSTSNSGGNAAELDACELLNSSGVPLTGVAPDDPGECNGDYETDVLVSLDIRDSGLNDYVMGPSSEASDTTIGGHKAKYVKKPTTAQSCAIVLELTSSSRIDVFATSDDDMNKSCTVVESIVKAIEPKLP